MASIKQRLTNRPDSEHGQAIVRLVLVSIVLVYFHTAFFESRVDESDLRAIKWLIWLSISMSAAIFGAILFRPAQSVVRRLTGMAHDVTAISASIYLGEGAGAAVAVIYLWITIGNGFRYGVRYLYGCAALCVSGYIIVCLTSVYWREQQLLSLNILLTMLVVPPYVGSLLKSLHTARDALQHRASIDALTGLLSRSEMEFEIGSLFPGNNSGHVLLFFDLDRFKAVNDIGGHAAGDQLLADVGGLVRDSVRKHDLSGRMGGDEFCVLLHDCSLEKAGQKAEEIRRKITSYRLEWGTEHFSVGVSIGVAPVSAANDSDFLFRLADAACYAAKNAGRNRVHVIDPRTDLLDTQKIRKVIETEACAQNR